MIGLTGAIVSYGLSFVIFWKSHTASNYSDIATSQMLISSNGMDRFMEHVCRDYGLVRSGIT